MYLNRFQTKKSFEPFSCNSKYLVMKYVQTSNCVFLSLSRTRNSMTPSTVVRH